MTHIPTTPASGNSLQFHPLADIFPLMEGKEFDTLSRRHRLAQNLKKTGQKFLSLSVKPKDTPKPKAETSFDDEDHPF